MSSRVKKLKYNTVASIVFQLTTLICGFILPKLILSYYGSETNGLVNSIAQFLQMIAFLELGVGAVVSSSLYKPLSEKNDKRISEIYISANNFFKKLSYILILYVILLIIIYPFLMNDKINWFSTATLIIAMSISSFAQYYFGIVDRILISSDQKGYINYNIQTITLILNNIACVILININCSIQILKLTTSLIYLLRPLVLRSYVNKHYNINKRRAIYEEPIQQKWNGVAQHVAAIVLDSTDNIILTVFSNLTNVSIYSVYYIVVNGIKNMFYAFTFGIQSFMGNMWACNEYDKLKKVTIWYEWFVHYIILIIFTCTGILVVPFISVYTQGVSDANYIQPVFGFFISLANASYCLRSPYINLVLAAGKYKETQNSYIIAAAINIVSSVILVIYYGLIGVALGTFISTLYQTLWLAHYCNSRLIHFGIKTIYKNYLLDLFTMVIIFCSLDKFGLSILVCQSYTEWFRYAFICFFYVFLITTFIQLLFNKEKCLELIYQISLRVRR